MDIGGVVCALVMVVVSMLSMLHMYHSCALECSYDDVRRSRSWDVVETHRNYLIMADDNPARLEVCLLSLGSNARHINPALSNIIDEPYWTCVFV